MFVKFCVTECEFCIGISKAWERLGKEWSDRESYVLIGNVNCDHQIELCQKFKITGTPTLIYGHSGNVQEYSGDKDFNSLNQFAEEVLASCGPYNTADCSDTEKTLLNELISLSIQDIEERIQGLVDIELEAERYFDEEVIKLQKSYDHLNQEHELTKANLKREIKLLEILRNHRQTIT
jgi:thioredoxin-like negative regulator of GroEL